MRTVVIGGGIIGASIAYHVAVRNSDVTILAGPRRGGIATAQSFAWINAAPGNERDYHELRVKAIVDWHRLQGELGARLAINWNGALWWHDDPDALAASVAEHASWGYPIRLVSPAEAAKQEPSLESYPDRSALSPLEGGLSPVATTIALLEAAVELGATVADDAACAIVTHAGRVTGVRTLSGEIDADQVVLAAGIASEELAGDVGVNLAMANLPGFLVTTAPVPPLLRGVVLSPGPHVRQNDDGRLIIGSDFGGGPDPDNPEVEAAALLASVRQLLALEVDLRVERTSLGIRPIPSDGHPIIGPAPDLAGLYVTVMHSGITLAALVGRLAAEEVLSARPVESLEPYRPGRFANG